MLELVLWSSSLALTPMALDLAWRLIAAVAGLIGPAAPTRSGVTEYRNHRRGAARRPALAAALEVVP
jgi:hypothetical protein